LGAKKRAPLIVTQRSAKGWSSQKEHTMSVRSVLGLTATLLVAAAVPARAAGPVPQALKSLKAYQVVEQVMAQRELLSLTDEQFARLDDLSAAVRSEKHRFTHQGGKPHNTRHVPMITRQQAYDQALGILTPEQRERFEAFYPAPAPESKPVDRKLTVPHGKP
jgi:Spy/CpxP family protein refolding chaperone